MKNKSFPILSALALILVSGYSAAAYPNASQLLRYGRIITESVEEAAGKIKWRPSPKSGKGITQFVIKKFIIEGRDGRTSAVCQQHQDNYPVGQPYYC
jgi:hypothetical protein